MKKLNPKDLAKSSAGRHCGDPIATQNAVTPASKELKRADELIAKINARLMLLSDNTMSQPTDKLSIKPKTNLLAYVKQLTTNSSAQIADKLQTLKPVIDSSSRHCEALSVLVSTQPILMLDSLETDETTESKLLAGLGSQHQALTNLDRIHSDILSLHSFQDLVSQATIEAANAVDLIKQDLEDVKTVLNSLHEFNLGEANLPLTQQIDNDSAPTSQPRR